MELGVHAQGRSQLPVYNEQVQCGVRTHGLFNNFDFECSIIACAWTVCSVQDRDVSARRQRSADVSRVSESSRNYRWCTYLTINVQKIDAFGRYYARACVGIYYYQTWFAHTYATALSIINYTLLFFACCESDDLCVCVCVYVLTK